MIATMLVAALTVSAQNDDLKNEIGAYYGFGSASNIVTTFAKAFTFSSDDRSGFWGPIGIEYYRHVTPVVAIGAMASIAGCTFKDNIGNNDGSAKYYTVMPAVKFNYLRRDHFGLYSGLAAGVMFFNSSYANQNDNSVNFMFQLTGIGAEFGGQQFRGFAEFGFGERGVLCAGLRYKF